jgi:hypothetical protein
LVNLGVIAYVERMHSDPAGMSGRQFVEHVGVCGETAACNDLPAIGGILLTEFQANSTV